MVRICLVWSLQIVAFHRVTFVDEDSMRVVLASTHMRLSSSHCGMREGPCVLSREATQMTSLWRQSVQSTDLVSCVPAMLCCPSGKPLP